MLHENGRTVIGTDELTDELRFGFEIKVSFYLCTTVFNYVPPRNGSGSIYITSPNVELNNSTI